MTSFLYLASQSPRRRELLTQVGVSHQLLLPDASEDAEALEVLQPGELPAAYVQRVTRLKLDAARQRLQRRGLPWAPILSADTTVALDQVIYGKPEDDADTARMLRQLSGRTHQVLTAIAVADGESVHEALSISEVRFRELTEADISAYIASGEPKGKAGAYAVQGKAAAFIEHISGSYSGVMGLPLFETTQLLTRIDLFQLS